MAGVGNISQIEMSVYNNIISLVKEYKDNNKLVRLIGSANNNVCYVPKNKIEYIEMKKYVNITYYRVSFSNGKFYDVTEENGKELIKNW